MQIKQNISTNSANSNKTTEHTRYAEHAEQVKRGLPTAWFIHGAGAQGVGQGSDNLAVALQQGFSGIQMNRPLMPQPESPIYEKWKATLDKEFAGLQGEVLLIGHSLGGSVLLKYICEVEVSFRITALMMIASPFWGGDEDWQEPSYQLDSGPLKLPVSEEKLYFYHSADDPIVPAAHLDYYRQRFPQGNYRQLNGCGHLFSDGLPILIEDCCELMGGKE